MKTKQYACASKKKTQTFPPLPPSRLPPGSMSYKKEFQRLLIKQLSKA